MRTTCLEPFRSTEGRSESSTDAAVQSELARQRRALWGLLDDGAFVGCMATMNPQILEELTSDQRRGRGHAERSRGVRHSERLLYRFLSRFVGRNDITGIAGTSFWGRFDGAAEQSLAFTRPRPSPSKIRLVYASPAHLLHLEQRVRWALARESCRPGLAPRVRLVDGVALDVVTGGRFPLEEPEVRLLRRCDGYTSVRELLAEDAEHAARLDRLADEGLVGRHAALPELRPLDRCLAAVVEVLSALDEVRSDEPTRSALAELVAIEERMRACPPRRLGALSLEADRLAAGLGPYRPVDPVATLRRLVAALACTEDCRERVSLVLSARFRWVDGELHDESRGSAVPLTVGERRIAERFGVARTVAAALAERGDTEGAEALGALRTLVERSVLCLADADPWRLEPSRTELAWDPWEKPWFESALGVLDSLELPPVLARPLRLLRSCRAVEQKSYEAAFPEFDPVACSERARRALATAGVEAVDARKDRSFFLVDSVLAGASVKVGGALLAAIREGIGPVLELLGMRPWAWERQVLLPGLRHELAPGERVPLPRALRWTEEWVREWEGPFRGSTPPVLESEYDQERALLRIHDIRYPAEYRAWLEDKRLVSTVDVMLAGSFADVSGGRFRLVLNEAHASGDGLPETMHVPWTSDSEGGFVRSHVDMPFRPDLLVLEPLIPTKQAHSIAWQLRGAALALRTPGRGSAWSGARLRVGDLDLVRSGDDFQVVEGGRAFAFLGVDLATGPIRTLRFAPRVFASRLTELAGVDASPGTDGVRVLPEIRIGELTVSRRMHVVGSAVLAHRLGGKEGRALLAAARRLAEDLALPRFVFVSLFAQKAFLCDLESLFALEVLTHALARNHEEVVIADMNPAPPDLWLEVGGGTVVSEWRFAAAADGAGFDPSSPAVLGG